MKSVVVAAIALALSAPTVAADHVDARVEQIKALDAVGAWSVDATRHAIWNALSPADRQHVAEALSSGSCRLWEDISFECADPVE